MFKNFKLSQVAKAFRAVLSGALLFSILLPTQASAINLLPVKRLKSVSIFSNSGGSIGKFALQSAQFRKSQKLVRFTGRCDSACTLYLALPAKQMCVAPGAFFRFHAPVHANARAARFAQTYMMRKYPGWVRGWIRSNHGLTRNLITMDYRYASRFIRTCSV